MKTFMRRKNNQNKINLQNWRYANMKNIGKNVFLKKTPQTLV